MLLCCRVNVFFFFFFNIKKGVALKPGTPISSIEHIIDSVDLVLVMTVEPGFGGQAFMSAPLQKGKSLTSCFCFGSRLVLTGLSFK